MDNRLEEIEECYSSHLKIENKEEFEKAMSDLYSELQSLDAYNLLV